MVSSGVAHKASRSVSIDTNTLVVGSRDNALSESDHAMALAASMRSADVTYTTGTLGY